MCPYIAIYSYQKGRLPSALTVCPYIAIYKTDTSFLHRSALPTGAPEQTHGPAPRGYGFGERVFDTLHLESYFIGFQEKRALEVRQTEFPGRRGEYQVRICISQIRHTYVCRLSARSYRAYKTLTTFLSQLLHGSRRTAVAARVGPGRGVQTPSRRGRHAKRPGAHGAHGDHVQHGRARASEVSDGVPRFGGRALGEGGVGGCIRCRIEGGIGARRVQCTRFYVFAFQSCV